MPNLATVDATSASTPTPVDSDPDMNEGLRRLRASRVIAEPATPAACARDYAAGAELRRKFDATARRQQRR